LEDTLTTDKEHFRFWSL